MQALTEDASIGELDVDAVLARRGQIVNNLDDSNQVPRTEGRLVSKKGELIVLGLAIAYGGLAQLLAGMWEFRTGNTFGAVAFSSYGAFWISFFFLVRLTPVGVTSNGVALYLYAWAIFTAYMFAASLRTAGAVALGFLLLTITFIFVGIGNASLAGTTDVTNGAIEIGGWLGLATAIAAWYPSFAAVINSTFSRIVLLVYPLKR